MPSGDFERSVIGYCALALPEDVLSVSKRLSSEKMEWNLHRMLYKKCVRCSQEGVSILDNMGDVDPWMETDNNGIRPLAYIGHCIDVRAENEHQLDVCIREIEADWVRRQMARIGREVARLADSRMEPEAMLRRYRMIVSPFLLKK